MDASQLPAAERAFAGSLGQARVRADLTQREVAERMQMAGFSWFRQVTVGEIERGNRRVRLGEAVELARITGMDLMAACGLRPAA